MKEIILSNGCSIKWDRYYKVYKVSTPDCSNAIEFKRGQKQLAIEWATNYH